MLSRLLPEVLGSTAAWEMAKGLSSSYNFSTSGDLRIMYKKYDFVVCMRNAYRQAHRVMQVSVLLH